MDSNASLKICIVEHVVNHPMFQYSYSYGEKRKENQDEIISALCELIELKPGIFLSRYGNLITHNHQMYFRRDELNNDYEVQYYLKELNKDEKEKQLQQRNRRTVALNRYISSTDTDNVKNMLKTDMPSPDIDTDTNTNTNKQTHTSQYEVLDNHFSLSSMHFRNPQLFREYISRFDEDDMINENNTNIKDTQKQNTEHITKDMGASMDTGVDMDMDMNTDMDIDTYTKLNLQNDEIPSLGHVDKLMKKIMTPATNTNTSVKKQENKTSENTTTNILNTLLNEPNNNKQQHSSKHSLSISNISSLMFPKDMKLSDRLLANYDYSQAEEKRMMELQKQYPHQIKKPNNVNDEMNDSDHIKNNIDNTNTNKCRKKYVVTKHIPPENIPEVEEDSEDECIDNNDTQHNNIKLMKTNSKLINKSILPVDQHRKNTDSNNTINHSFLSKISLDDIITNTNENTNTQLEDEYNDWKEDDLIDEKNLKIEDREFYHKQFFKIMEENFIEGEDNEYFDYKMVDENEDFDDYEQMQRDAEDKYFDETDDEQ